MKPSSSRIKKWHNWFNQINQEIFHLYNVLQIIDELQIILQNNSIKHSENILWPYFPRALMFDTIFRISKLCEKQDTDKKKPLKKKIISLLALLEEFEEYNDFFSRKRFVGNKPTETEDNIDAVMSYREATKIYDEYAGKGNIIDKVIIRKDIEELNKAHKRIKTYRNKILAHTSIWKRKIKVPKFEEIDKCRKLISKIAKKYYFLLANSSYLYNTKPDISDIFLAKWIDSDEQLKKYREEMDLVHKRYE